MMVVVATMEYICIVDDDDYVDGEGLVVTMIMMILATMLVLHGEYLGLLRPEILLMLSPLMVMLMTTTTIIIVRCW